MGVGLVCVGRQLDPAGLAPPSHLDLGLQNDGVADPFGQLDGLVSRDGEPPGETGMP